MLNKHLSILRQAQKMFNLFHKNYSALTYKPTTLNQILNYGFFIKSCLIILLDILYFHWKIPSLSYGSIALAEKF